MYSNRRLQQLPAFTIMELTVSMIVAALVVSIAYSVYFLINKAYLDYRQRNQHFAELIQLDRLLKHDFRNADQLLLLSGQLYAKKGNKRISYEFNKSNIIRRAELADTFRLSVQDKNFMCENIKIPAGNAYNRASPDVLKTDFDIPEHLRVDELALTVLFNNSPVRFIYKKRYSSVDLIKRGIHAIN
ncbi:PulJ/GspJ family protein [Desertivirga xinjiangensis]|uniref:PulJ/GspJ family protein n=1 Tax=Desertivirga xinjiangensis TaxID=539206 RepID=UPI00210E8DFD|nr:hypothetical protein [Pedobacter xinjiangensis]